MTPPTLDELVAEIRVAKVANRIAVEELKKAQDKSDAAWERLGKAQRAAGAYIDQLTSEPPSLSAAKAA